MSFGKASSSENSQTNQSQNGTQSQTQTPNNLGALQQGWAAAENNLNGGNGGANSALDLITGNATGASNAANTGLDAVLKLIQGGATNGANQYLTPTASGANIGNNNPGFQNVVDQIARSAQQSTDGNFAAAGRYGSGANANAFNSQRLSAPSGRRCCREGSARLARTSDPPGCNRTAAHRLVCSRQVCRRCARTALARRGSDTARYARRVRRRR